MVKRISKKEQNVFSDISLILTSSYYIAYLVSQILKVAMRYVDQNDILIMDRDVRGIISSFVPMYLICFPLVINAFKKIKCVQQDKRKSNFTALFKMFIMCFPIMFIGSLTGRIISGLLSGGKAENKLDDFTELLSPVMMIIAAFIGPVFEEIVFRKMIIDRTIQYGKGTAVFFSALIFGAFHMSLYQFFYAFGIGLILGYIYVSFGNLKYTILIHIIFNGTSSIIVPLLVYHSKNGDVLWMHAYRIYTLIYFLMVTFGAAIIIQSAVKLKKSNKTEKIHIRKYYKISVLNKGTIMFMIFSILIVLYSLIFTKTTYNWLGQIKYSLFGLA